MMNAGPKPVKNLDVIGKLSLQPERRPEFFVQSKLQEPLFIKPPNSDSAGDRIELINLQNDRENKRMLHLQQEMLAHAKRQSSINSNRVHEIYQMQHDLKNRFIEANEFIKDCEDKKTFAELKVADEKEIHMKLKQDIQKYKKDIKVLAEFRTALKATVKDLEPYEKVMAEVVQEVSVFSSVKDCIDRSDALMMTQVEIDNLKREKLQKIEDMRKSIIKLTTEASLTVLGLNNELAELQRAYAQANTDCLKWEKVLGSVKDCIMDARKTRKCMQDEIFLICRMLCRRRGTSFTINPFNFELQLNFIRDEIQIIKEVVNECTAKPKPQSSKCV